MRDAIFIILMQREEFKFIGKIHYRTKLNNNWKLLTILIFNHLKRPQCSTNDREFLNLQVLLKIARLLVTFTNL